jgi:hypothetical protein
MHNGFAIVDVAFDADAATAHSADAEVQQLASSLAGRANINESAAHASVPSEEATAAAPVSAVTGATVLTYKAHTSLAYGADWCIRPLASDDASPASADIDLIATCSFYDKQLDVWVSDRSAAMPSLAPAAIVG